MLRIPKGQTTDAERAILRQLRVWIAAMAAACLVVGVGIGAMLTGNRAVAQNEVVNAAKEAQIARAPEALSASFAEIARRVEPAVVNINTVSAAPEVAEKKEGAEEEEGEGGSDNPLLDMLRRQSRRPARGVGSGFIVDPKGLILTNYHVIEGVSRIMVKLESGETLRGRVVGFDSETDLAVVKVDPRRDLPSVRLGDSDTTQVGDWVLAIGSPFGLEQTVTAGIISTKERTNTPGASNFQRFLQTDAAINRGNSGGPLVNMRGEVIGVNSQIATSTGDYNGIGFALPSNIAASVFRQLMSEGKVRRGYLGVYLEPVSPEFASVYGMAEAKGAIVRDIANPQTPAARAGLQTNDVIVEFNGQPITSAQDLINKVADTPVGHSAQVVYLRETNDALERRSTNLVVGERPPRPTSALDDDDEGGEAKPDSKEQPKAEQRPTLGIKLSELTPQIANERNLKGVRGLFVTEVDQAGLAYEGGLRRYAVIQRVNRQPVNSLDDFERIVNSLKPGDPVVMNVAGYDGRRIVQSLVQFTFQ